MLTATTPYKITEEPWVVDSSSSMIKWGGAAYRWRCDDADLNDNAITCGHRAIKRLRKVRKVRGTNVGVQFKPMHRSYGTTKMGGTRFANLKLRTSHKLFWRDMFAATFFSLANMLRFLPSAESARLKWWNGLDWKRENCKMKKTFTWFLVFFSASTSDADQHVILVKLIRHVRLPSLFFRFSWNIPSLRLRICRRNPGVGI